MIVDGQGRRIDAEPADIVRDGPVVNGLSCMNCHARGPIATTDQIRGTIATNKALPSAAVESVLALYPPGNRMAELMVRDAERLALASGNRDGDAGRDRLALRASCAILRRTSISIEPPPSRA